MGKKEPVITPSSGNPFADLGMSDPDTRMAKAQLAQKITAIMHEQELTQAQIAERMDIDQPQVSKITRGLLKDFSLDRLMELVKRLNQNIDITVYDNPEPSQPARTVVHIGYPEHALAADGSHRADKVHFD